MTGLSGEKKNLVARTRLFVRQVIVELRRVVWPTRKQVTTYTGVVLVFVSALSLIVAVLDFVFGTVLLLESPVERLRAALADRAVHRSADEVAAAFAPHCPTMLASTMAEAVECAATMASSGDVVLLSPACASLDQFANYVERGEQYRRFVLAHLAEAKAFAAFLKPLRRTRWFV